MRRFGVRIPTGSRKKPGCTCNRAFLCPPSLSSLKRRQGTQNARELRSSSRLHARAQNPAPGDHIVIPPELLFRTPVSRCSRAFHLTSMAPPSRCLIAAISECQRRWLPLQHLAYHHPDCRRSSLLVHAFMAYDRHVVGSALVHVMVAGLGRIRGFGGVEAG